MAPSLSASEVSALRKVVEAARDDSAVLPDFFKDFMKSWGAKIPAVRYLRFVSFRVHHPSP
jgi:hypothetical protein